jgi:hypothetical protein
LKTDTDTVEASQSSGLASSALTAATLNALINSTDGTITNNLDGDDTNTQSLILTTTDSKTYLVVDIDADGVFVDGTDVIVQITGVTVTSFTDDCIA